MALNLNFCVKTRTNVIFLSYRLITPSVDFSRVVNTQVAAILFSRAVANETGAFFFLINGKLSFKMIVLYIYCPIFLFFHLRCFSA